MLFPPNCLIAILFALLIAAFQCSAFAAEQTERPNIILVMADDLGYGDTGFNGNAIIQTPHLDSLARQGVKLTHFYSGNSVCSPTRGTCLTGRHHDRYGIYNANAGHLPKQEITLARILKEKGYTTGHFGKWHLGTLSKTESSKGKKRKPELNYAPPWDRDYDASFVTESAVSTWNPGLGKRAIRNPFYENGVPVDGNDESLKGGAARVVVDRAAPFMQNAIDTGQSFFAVVWFHAPHEDIQAGSEYLKKYEGHGEAARYYGCITELDEQVGRITRILNDAKVADNTLIFFCSDNGPEGRQASGRRAGTTAGLRGRKRALYDGGVRVPALAVWPGHIPAATESDTILTTLDYFPTIQNIIGYEMPDDRPLDGQDAMPIMTGQAEQRITDIRFRFAAGEASIIHDQYKFLLPARELFDLSQDWTEENNIAAQKPEVAESMERDLVAFFDDVQPADFDGYLTTALSNDAADFVQRNKEQPFFLYVAYNAPHAPQQDIDRYSYIKDPKRRNYAAMVDVMDAGIGKVLNALDENGLREDTLVFFLSDNGGPQPTKKQPKKWNGSSNTPFRGGKGNLYDGGVHVPFIVSWPKRIAAGSKFDHPVISLDIAATAVAVAEVPEKLTGDLEGADLTPVFADTATSPPHDYLYWREGEGTRWSVLSADRYKHLQDKKGGPEELLYLPDDIGETNDLAAASPDRVSLLRSQWGKWNESNKPNRMDGYKSYHKHRDQFFLDAIPSKATKDGYSPTPVPTFQ